MNTEEILDRWKEIEFLKSVGPSLEKVFVQKRVREYTDLQGIIVGLDGAIDRLATADFQEAALENVDLSFGRISCSLIGGQFQDCRFEETLFDTCQLTSAKMIRCDFNKAKLHSPWLNDTNFEECNFSDTVMIGRGCKEYGGRRTLFQRCQFSRVVIQNLAFRACRFVSCSFEKVVFQKSLLVSVTFEDGGPESTAFASSEIKRVLINGITV